MLDSCRYLETQGFTVTYLPVLTNGLVDLDTLRSALRPDTSLVSIMAVNNEIGVIQPLREISETLKAWAKETKNPKPYFHTDAAQAVGKIPIDVEAMGIDAMSISGHKIYGPKGIGAAYVRRRPRVRLEPLIHGGGQERGLRSGTVPAPLAVGLGEASRLAKKEMSLDHQRVKRLSDRLINGINAKVEQVVRNGDPDGYPGCVNLSFSYVEGESLLMALKVSFNLKLGCTSLHDLGHRAVIRIGLYISFARALLCLESTRSSGGHGSFVIAFRYWSACLSVFACAELTFMTGRFTTEQEIDLVVERVSGVVDKLREMSPLWEMVQDGIDLSKIEWSQ